MSLSAHVVHTTTKQVITRRRKHENGYEVYENEKCTCKACKTTRFSSLNMQIYDVLVAWACPGRLSFLTTQNYVPERNELPFSLDQAQ